MTIPFQPSSDTPIVIEGARTILPDGEYTSAVRIEGGIITGIDRARDGARVIDGRGLILAPALVDIHGDAFERQLMPRPGVQVPLEAALMEADRQLAGCGIATAFHALSLSWEPGLRSVAQGEAVLKTLGALGPRFAVEHRLQLRWETFCFEAEPLMSEALAGPLTPAVAFNDHTSMALLHPDTSLQDRPFDHAPDYPVVDTGSATFIAKMKSRAARAGLTAEAYVAELRGVWDRRADVPRAIDRVAEAGRAAGAAMLSHDDSQDETRDYYRAKGAHCSEFPMRVDVARAAREAGDHVVFGAPNAMRGGSHLGSPSAGPLVAEGVCDILASDYWHPAMLGAVARLFADGVAPLHRLWSLVSGNPAVALGLTDRGRIAEGMRADLVLLDWPTGGQPAPRLTLCGGRTAFCAEPAG